MFSARLELRDIPQLILEMIQKINYGYENPTGEERYENHRPKTISSFYRFVCER